MRRESFVPLFVLCLVFTSCGLRPKRPGRFDILPSPKRFEVTGISSLRCSDIRYYHISGDSELPVRGELLQSIVPVESKSKAQIVCSIDETIETGEEGYLLNIYEKQITVSGKDKAGLFYGFATLEQLMEDAKEQNANLPECRINDFPLLPYRAVHLDVKHHLEKRDYYYKLLDKLASYKVNAVIVELEDKIQYVRQREVASSDALSIDEWKKLCDYAIERNIEISPLVQGLGHASFILKHEKYKELRDDPESDWAFNPLDSKTYEVQFDLYLDAIDATPHGKYLHVGGDEVHTTGRKSGKPAMELQLVWLNKVCAFAEKHGRIPIFWDDMPLVHAKVYAPTYKSSMSVEEVDRVWEENGHKLSQFIDKFPKNCIYMRWNYQTPQAIGNTRAMEWFIKNGMQVMGATAGQTRWVLMPQNESNIKNIKDFVTLAQDKGIDGMLCTLWDDDSPHFELYWRGIIAFAEYSWAGDKRDVSSLKSAYRHREFSNSFIGAEYAFIDKLEKPVAFWKSALLKKDYRGRLVKFESPLEKAVIDFPDRNNRGEWSKYYNERLKKAKVLLEVCDEVAETISVMKSKTVRNSYRLKVYECVNSLARFAPEALLALKDFDNAQSKQQEDDAINKIKQLSQRFETVRGEMEQVYGETRILNKPDGYILDQDHHRHLANQSISFDWQFLAEMLFIEKVETGLLPRLGR